MPSRPRYWKVLLTMITVRGVVLVPRTSSSALALLELSPSKRITGWPLMALGTRSGCLATAAWTKSLPLPLWSIQVAAPELVVTTPLPASRW